MEFEELQLKISTLQLKQAQINLEIRKTKISLSEELISHREKCTREVELLTLEEQRDLLVSEIKEMSSQLSHYDDTAASAISIITEPPFDLDEFNLPIPRPITSNAPPPFTQTHAETSQQHNTTVSRPPPTFSMQLAKPHVYKSGDDISLFLERFKQFVALSQLRESNLHLYLLSLIQDDKIYRKLGTISLSPDQKSDPELLISAYEDVLFPATETRILRSSMSSLRQKSGESIADFTLRIQKLAAKAYSDFEMRDESSISALISGIEGADIKRKLLGKDLHSFDHAIQLATKHERICQTLSGNTVVNDEGEFSVLQVTSNNAPALSTLAPTPTLPDSPHPSTNRIINRPNHREAGPSYHPPREENRHHNLVCYNCNEVGHIANSCPDTSIRNSQDNHRITCYICHRRGHYATSCPDRRNPPPRNNPLPRQNNARDNHTSNTAPLNCRPAGEFPMHPSRH